MTIDRTAEEILDDMIDDVTTVTPSEIVALCESSIDGIAGFARYDALERALARAGWSIIDITTDDTDGTVLELVPPDIAG